MLTKESTVQKIRQVPISEILVAENIAFKRIGREVVTICPWHSDTNPSLTVNDDKNICFCFACGGGSDGIAYVQQKFGLTFSEAIERIAQKHAIVIEYDDIDIEESLRLAAERKKLVDSVKSDHEKYRICLRNEVTGFRARQWLIGRDIEPSTSREFGIGWAPSGYFADRVVVPIHDHRGTIVGFTGRRISEDSSPQKYKNSASSQLFDKGALIFNEHRALEQARIAGYVVFVEGHFDVISLWQHGIKNVVATQGTAGPSRESIKRLMRQCRRFVLCYDGDSGGNKAIEHFLKVAGPLACQGELTITIAQLPEGKDPDDCIRNGIDIHAIIESAPQWLDWQIDCWLRNVDRSDTHRFSLIEKAIRELVESIKSPALRQFYVDKASKVLAEDSKSAAKLAQSWNKTLPKIFHAGSWSRPVPSWVRTQVERRVLRSYIHIPETRQKLKPLMDRLNGPSHIWLWKRLEELERFAADVTPDMVMSILAVCEPHYTRTLRSIVVPTIKVLNQDGIIEHAEHVLSSTIEADV
jgi:DNA primase